MPEGTEELLTHGDNDDNTTDIPNDRMIKFDPTEAAQNITIEHIANRIVDHVVVNG